MVRPEIFILACVFLIFGAYLYYFYTSSRNTKKRRPEIEGYFFNPKPAKTYVSSVPATNRKKQALGGLIFG